MPRGRRKASADIPPLSMSPAATTPEGRENQLIAKAYDLAEKRIMEGTASAQEITYFLKRGSSKERREEEMMAEQQKLITAKTHNVEAVQKSEEFYKKVLDAMRLYTGHGEDDEYIED